jgi:biotin-dependent carboxylase-like uncharacterized protein
VYDGDDLDEVARASGLSRDEVIARHMAREYAVEVVGFLPGFAYLGELDPALVLPRRASPRTRVPAGSVAIAGRYTGIYPAASPGGWHLLGRARGVRLFDPEATPPSLFAPGDVVTFREASRDASVARPLERPAITASGPAALEIVKSPLHACVQDLGRRGWKARGVPESGAWDKETHAAANLAVGNTEGAATLELPLDSFDARALADVWFSVDGEPPTKAREGERIHVPAVDSAVRYLAIEGGIDVPLVLGSRSTLLSAGFGGFEGRRVRRGDRLHRRLSDGDRSTPRAPSSSDVRSLSHTVEIAIVPGPHLDRFEADSFDRLTSAELRISNALDRTGTRLDGARVTRRDGDAAVPAPMIRGAVQVSTDGTPIVLGPDAATTGGYPVIAVVTERARATFARLRPGSAVRFAVG